MKKKITLQLTDIGLHHRSFREAKTLDKTIKGKKNGLQYGRIYNNEGAIKSADGRFRFFIKLPKDLQRQVDAGEIEVDIVMPKEGIPVFAAPDALEKAAQLKKKERLRLARSSQTWKKV